MTKEAAIREMVESLRNAGYFKGVEPEDIVKAILKRENLGSTGIGRGVAIPHTKHTSVDRLVGTVAVSGQGIPFNSVDGEPVYLLVLLVSPQDRPGEGIGLAHVRTMVRRLGGTIRVDSELGQGTTFTIILPKRWTA